MRIMRFGVLSAAIAFSAPGPRPPQAPPAAISGRVTAGSGVDARPVRRARVTITGGGLTAPRVADTDAAGAYAFDRLPGGPFKVRVQKAGFVTLDGEIAASPSRVPALVMTRGGAIDGVVTDAGGEPVWNVVVTALQMDAGKPKPIALARTDDLGRYRIHSLPAGDYFVEASTDRASLTSLFLMAGEKYPEVNKGYYPAATAIEDARPVMVSVGRDSDAVDITFTPSGPVTDPSAPPRPQRPDRTGTGRIAGIVTDAATGKPVRAAEILLLPAPGQGQRLTDWTRTDARGRFEYTSLPAQRYTIQFQSPRYLTAEFGQQRAGGSGIEIDLHDAEDFRADMKLRRPAALEGTIFDDFGDPAPGISMQLAQRLFVAGRRRLAGGLAGGRVTTAPTDDLGHYRIVGPPPGDYYVWALSGVYTDVNEVGGFAPTYYPGTIDAGAATPVTLAAGGESAAATFALVPAKTFSVSGTMVDAEGKPVSGRGTLMLMTPDSLGRMDFNIARAITTSDGAFVLRNVPQGQYTLQGFAPPPPGYRGPGNLGAMPFGWLPLSVGDSSLDGVLLKTTSGTTLRGRFVLDDSTASPPKSDQLSVLTIPLEFDSAPVAGGPSPQEIHDDLTFEVTHQSGMRRIFADVRSPAWMVKTITVGARDVTDTSVDLRTKDVDGVEVVLTSKVSRVSGGVTDDKGSIADYVVVIFASDSTKWIDRSRFVALVRPTQQGRFMSSPLPPEDYLAIALPGASPQEIYDPDFLQQLRAQATSFTLNAGETRGLELKLKRRP